MLTLTNDALGAPDAVRNLGHRFREYRMRMRLTRKDVSEAAAVGMTTLYKFESGHITDISFGTLHRLMRTIGLGGNWDLLIPDLPESPYMYDRHNRKMQRVRKSKNN